VFGGKEKLATCGRNGKTDDDATTMDYPSKIMTANDFVCSCLLCVK